MNLRLHAARLLAVAMLVAVAGSAMADSSATPPRLPGVVAINQKLNSQVPLDLMFRDEEGRVVRLGQYFNHNKPVVLFFMYYSCPMLCSVVAEGTTNALTEVKFDIGKEYEVITVSIDPRDTAAQAAEKKDKYVKRYGRLSAAEGWHFLTGHESAIKKLTSAVGFDYAYDPQSNQFAHGAAIMILTPGGRVSRYFPGFEFKPRDIRLGLVEASQNKIGGVADQLLLLCFHYNPATGKYSRSAMNFVRAGGAATFLGLVGFIFVMVRGERKRHGATSDPNETIQQ